MKFLKLKEKINILNKQKREIDLQIKKLNKQIKILPEYTFQFLNLEKTIIKEKSPYIYKLLTKISMIDNDERNLLEWGRGKNIVNYNGVEFTYNEIRYTVGYAHNWCTGEYLYTKYENTERNFFSITNEDIEELDEIWRKGNLKNVEEFLKKDSKSELGQISLFIFVNQNLME